MLGRHWVIKRDDGKLEAVVQKSPDNGIVGEDVFYMNTGLRVLRLTQCIQALYTAVLLRIWDT